MNLAPVLQKMLPAAQYPASSEEDYDILVKCGEGTYGCVYKAKHKKTGQLVALKKVVNVPKEDGSPVELKYLLQLCSARNVVKLRDYFWSKEGQLCLCFEYMAYDLWRLMSGPSIAFDMLQIKCVMKQMLEGLYQCHSQGIMHRDIKPSNLLINSEGILKLADFGLTTSFLSGNYLSNNVVSLYYRPPELLMGSHVYGPEIDMWSVGCILIEMITNNYLFAGANEKEQLDLIFQVFGTPSEESWPGISRLPGWGTVDTSRQYPIRELREIFNFLSPDALDLVSRMMTMDPKQRITSWEALQHPWFWTSPLPCPPCLLPRNWDVMPKCSGYRKYQTDFPRSRKLYELGCATNRGKYTNNPDNRARRTRGRGRGKGTTSNYCPRSSRVQHHYSPYQRKYGYTAQHPIVIP